MKFGTINENGKSQVVVRINEEYACKLSNLEKLIGCNVSQDIIELISSIEKDKKLFLKFQKKVHNVRKMSIATFEWLPPIQKPSKIFGEIFERRREMENFPI